MSKSVLSVQATLHCGVKRSSAELLKIPASVAEEVADCLIEVLNVIEVGIVDENGSSAMRDRCFHCFSRAKRLVHLLQSTLKEGGG